MTAEPNNGRLTSVAMGCASSHAAAGLRRSSSCSERSSASAVSSLYGSSRWHTRSRPSAARATSDDAPCFPLPCSRRAEDFLQHWSWGLPEVLQHARAVQASSKFALSTRAEQRSTGTLTGSGCLGITWARSSFPCTWDGARMAASNSWMCGQIRSRRSLFLSATAMAISRHICTAVEPALSARSHWAEKAFSSPQIRRGRMRVPSPALPRLSLSSEFGFWEKPSPGLARIRTRRKVLRRNTPGEADVAQPSPEKTSPSVDEPLVSALVLDGVWPSPGAPSLVV